LRALDEYTVQGIRTNVDLFKRILADNDFRTAAIDTGYLERLMARPLSVNACELADIAALAAAFFEGYGDQLSPTSPTSPGRDVGRPGSVAVSKWKDASRREGLRS
jgi:acetyl-CoA carboxylase biotin carboxylase subunit